MKLTVLTENTTGSPHLIAEHGLSLYLETKNLRLLFDTGQTDALIANAAFLGVDLGAVDLAVLSHGHYDHGGGIAAFLQHNAKAKVYHSRHAFGEHYNAANRYIGLDPALQQENRLVPVGDSFALCPHMTLFSCNDASFPEPVEPFGLQIMRQGRLQPDDFLHEQYLLIEEKGQRILISGCSHKGVCNLAAYFRPDVLIGGLHLSKLDPQAAEDAARLDAIAAKLLRLPTRYYTCHCTGEAQYAYLREKMGQRLSYLRTGDTLEL
ncbi:MAG: MBL fold metallo-hydrolase [Oscillospiraceae bacterium]|nr:MBL fold metallo-hydrolase [Oscillospiraceae bacterium]